MLSVRGVTVSFGALQALRGVDLDVERGEIVCLLGPSGCGKTTLLRVVAGLEQAQGGDVVVEGKSVMGVPVYQRDIGLMFQDFALFPHMNVAQNVIFGLRMREVGEGEQRRCLQEALELVGLQGFEQRDVSQLSGGERQRVALARSLAPNPRLLMLDEPLGSLDATLRERLVVELREIIQRVGLTALYVTHDQQEAYAVADRIAVMNAGRIEQVANPQTLYRRPETVFVARFLGLHNVVPVTRRDGSRWVTALGEFAVEGEADAILLHPDGAEITSPDTLNATIGLVKERVFLGDLYRLEMQPNHSDMMLRFWVSAWNTSVPAPGDSVAIRFKPEWVIPLRERN